MSIKEYYIPKMEEFINGYEFEYKYYDEKLDDYTENWIKSKFDVRSGLSHDLIYQLRNNTIRVLYLTEQQIIDEGWVPIEVYPNGTSIYQKGSKENGYETVYNFEKKEIMFRKLYYYGLDEKYTNTKLILNTLECKSINEFRDICKLLKIN